MRQSERQTTRWMQTGGQKTAHLTESERAAYAAGTLEGEGRVHLTSCAACREESVRLRTILIELAAQIHAEAERSDAFFRAQRAKISSRLEERRCLVRRWRST